MNYTPLKDTLKTTISEANKKDNILNPTPNNVENSNKIMENTSPNVKILKENDNNSGKTLIPKIDYLNNNITKNKKEYRAFIRLLKANKMTTGVLASQIIGVSRQTISKWLQTPLALKVLSDTLNNRIKVIEKSKDWKAHAYLIDKLVGKQEQEQSTIDLKQMIVINT